MRIFNLFLLIVLISSSCSCQDKKNKKSSKSISAETLMKINKSLVGRDNEKIKAYLVANDLTMQQTETGLWYVIHQPGSGEIKKGQMVSLKYTIHLLDGTMCYASDSLGLKSFLVGQGGVETGLEEGVLLLGKGAKATFIMPPYQAHGLIGDDDKIPGRAIIIYDVEVVNVTDK